jgi:hypothetical protein
MSSYFLYPEEQPELRIYFAPGAMRNRERVSHKAKRKWSRNV